MSIIKKEWDEFRAVMVSEFASLEHWEEMNMAFYAGARCLFNILIEKESMLDDPKTAEKFVDEIHKEMKDNHCYHLGRLYLEGDQQKVENPHRKDDE